MRTLIPGVVMSVCAEIVSNRETRSRLISLFTYAGAPGDPPTGSNKLATAEDWLRRTNNDETVQPLMVLGKIIERFMEDGTDPGKAHHPDHQKDRERINWALGECQLQYVSSGKITGSLGSPSRTLEDFIRDRDSDCINLEFERALANVEASPRDAVSAASNILESICKDYIAEEALVAPAKLDLQSLWAVVRKHLGFDPSAIEDQDLKKILSGLISTVDGIGSLRTHASSAHGAGKKPYRLEARHARLAVHAAHTVALFILETWDKKLQRR